MPQPKRGATHYYAQIALQDKDCAIETLVVCNSLNFSALGPSKKDRCFKIRFMDRPTYREPTHQIIDYSYLSHRIINSFSQILK